MTNLFHQKLSVLFWDEALKTAENVRNMVKPINKPIGLWKKRTRNLEKLGGFGYCFWYVLPKQKLRILNSRILGVIIIGFVEKFKD